MNNTNKDTRGIEVIIHALVWAVMFFLTYTFTVGVGRSWGDLFVHFWSQLFFLAIIFYFNYFFAVNMWLFNHEKLLFYLTNLLLVVFFVWLRHEIITTNINEIKIPVEKKEHNGPPFAIRFYIDFLIYLIPVAFSIAIQSGKRMAKIEAINKEAENIRLQSELQHLKYQLQPHFFFNSLNNIYALIDINPEKAKHGIHSLSKLMRHLLQNSEVEKIKLSDEIDFLKKYIALMTLRQNEDTRIESYFPDNTNEVLIAPLLFVSIVENAFKHGVAATKTSWIFFEMKVEKEQLIFVSKNYNFPKKSNDMSGSGIGIENLKKRLALLYNNNHTLEAEVQNDLYIVTLTLNISLPN